MAIPVKVVEQPVELRPGGDSSTVRRTNPCGYDPLSTANGATPGKPNRDRAIEGPGINGSQPGSRSWPRG